MNVDKNLMKKWTCKAYSTMISRVLGEKCRLLGINWMEIL